VCVTLAVTPLRRLTGWNCLAAKLRPSNVHSAHEGDELLVPEIERQQAEGKRVAFRADAAFANPRFTRPWRRGASTM
jgi:hypothetical protein